MYMVRHTSSDGLVALMCMGGMGLGGLLTIFPALIKETMPFSYTAGFIVSGPAVAYLSWKLLQLLSRKEPKWYRRM